MTKRAQWIERILVLLVSFIVAYLYIVFLNASFGRKAYYPFFHRRYLAFYITPIFVMFYWLIKISMQYKDFAETKEGTMGGNSIKYVVALLFCIISFAVIINSDLYSNRLFGINDRVDGVVVSTNCLERGDESYIIDGDDPFVIFGVPRNQYRWGYIRLSEKVEEDTKLCIYYASIGDDEAFSDEKKVNCTVKKGRDFIIIEFDENNSFDAVKVKYDSFDVGDKFNFASAYVIKESLITVVLGYLSKSAIKLILVFGGFLLLFLLIKVFPSFIDNFDNDCRLKEGIYLLCIFALPIILLWQFLFGGYAFLFSDIASDSLDQMYPDLLHVAERIHNGQWGSRFAFTIGLGNSENSIFPNLFNWVSLFGTKNVAYLIGISMYFKMALSGAFAFGLAKQFEVSDDVCIIAALGYEFCAMLTVRACWQGYSVIAFSVVFWLFFFEYVFRHERRLIAWILYGFATEICFLQFSTYYSVLYGGIFVVYITCRCLTEKRSLFSWIKYIVFLILFAVFAIADSFIKEFSSSASSSRIAGGYSSAFSYIYFRWQMLYEAFIRTIGQTIQGISNDFIGINNVLEGPAFYFGILMLLLVPVAFYNVKKSKKILFGIGLIGSVLFIGVPFLREVVAGFSGASFKYTSFWITVLFFILILEAFKNIRIEGFRKGSLLVFNITAFICLCIHISILFSDEIARIKSWWVSLVYLLIYTVCINFTFYYKKQFKIITILVVITEGVVLSWGVLNGNGRVPMMLDSLDNRYYDNIYYAMKQNKKNNPGWYRSETYPSSMTNSTVQGYYGTAAYIGGTGINSSVQNYVAELGLPAHGIRWIYGTQGNIYANSLLGVKYIYTTDSLDNYGLRYINTYENVNVYENDLALPLGYFYDEKIDQSDFDSLTYLSRAQVLLDKCLVQKPGEIVNVGVAQYTTYENDYTEIPVSEIMSGIDITACEGKLYAIELNFSDKSIRKKADYQNNEIDKSYLDLFNGTGQEEITGFGVVNYSTLEKGIKSKIFAYGGVIEIDAENIDRIWFDDQTLSVIDGIRLHIFNRNEYYANIVGAIKRRKKNGMLLTASEDNSFSGTITAPKNGVFATSIPYDDNWEIYIDGEKQKTYQVNTGFVGCYMGQGYHDVYINYAHESWLFSNKYKVVGLFFILVCYGIIIIYKKGEIHK